MNFRKLVCWFYASSYAIDIVDTHDWYTYSYVNIISGVFFINFWWFQNFQLRSQRTKHLIKWISLRHGIKKVPRIPTNVPYFHACINKAVGICNRFQCMMKYAVDSTIFKLNCYRISMQKFLTFQQHTHLFSFWVLSAMQWIWPYLIHHFDIQNKRSTKRRKKKTCTELNIPGNSLLVSDAVTFTCAFICARICYLSKFTWCFFKKNEWNDMQWGPSTRVTWY